MKKLLIPLIAISGLLCAAEYRKTFKLSWDAPDIRHVFGWTNIHQAMSVSNELVWETNVYEPSVFRVYSTTNLKWSTNLPQTEITRSTNWTLYSTVPATGLEVRTNVYGVREFVHTMPITFEPGERLFVVTESNFWGESPFSYVAWTPELPQATNKNLRIE